jgi:hypothetical protein
MGMKALEIQNEGGCLHLKMNEVFIIDKLITVLLELDILCTEELFNKEDRYK